jgi:hypothetical protein
MRALVVHDRDGTIRDIVLAQPDAPAVFLGSDPGHSVTEVELPDGAINFESEQEATKALRDFRVEMGGEARLVRKPAEPDA